MSNMAGPSAAENVGLVWNPPPHPDPSRLDVWFLAGSQRSPPVPFFPEVHEELTRLWKAPFTARNKSGLWLLPPHHPWWWSRFGVHGNPLCGVVCGYATMSAEPGLPARACKYSSGLTGSAYRTCGEAASALHTMAILQVHQAKAFRDLHEGGHDLVFLHELHAATDLALRATNGCAHSQLPRRLAQTCTVLQAVVCTQGPGAQAPQPAGPLGQLGKEQTHAMQRISFLGIEFDSVNQTARLTQKRAQSVLNCFKAVFFIRQDNSPTETLSEAPGAYGCSCGDSSARSAPYETASVLAPWPNPEVGVETRNSPGSDYTGLLQNLQPVVRSLMTSGWSAPGAGIQTCCGIRECLGHRLGSHVQRASCIRGLNGSPTALAYHLPRAAGSMPCLEPPQRAAFKRKDILVRTNNTATIAYINQQGGLRSCRMSQLARHLLLWSQKHLMSLRAMHIPGVFNWAADMLSRAALPGEWRLHSQAVQLIWGRFGAAQVDLFASP